MNPPPTAQRRHDLDALRAFAMLLGIALHSALSFTGFPWIVQDTHSSVIFGLAVGAIHGFRMQAFMLVSGYFSMMLYRRRGLRALLSQRARRVLAPCLVGLITVVPALDLVSGRAMRLAATSADAPPANSAMAIYDAVRKGDTAALKKALEAGADPNLIDIRYGVPMLSWAALKGDVDSARILLEAGARPDIASASGYRPIHNAAFLGHVGVLELLAERGADLAARSKDGESAADTARADQHTTDLYARMLGVKVRPQDELHRGRQECLAILEKHLGDSPAVPLRQPGLLTKARFAYGEWIGSDRFLTGWKRFGMPIHLFRTDLFHHLWFLWFLCWLVGGFALVMSLIGSTTSPGSPNRWLLGTRGFVTMVTLTMLPQLFMGTDGVSGLGPDTSTGVLPLPHVLLYYAMFFAFGAFLYDGGEQALASFETGWWLRIGLCLALPVSLVTYGNPVTSGLAQCVYSWAMVFGLLCVFRRKFPAENPTIRYLSDSSYWLYLVHLPLVVEGQSIISKWNLPSGVKFLGLVTVLTVLLLISYQLLVRYTVIGLFLNGTRNPRPRETDHRIEPGSPQS